MEVASQRITLWCDVLRWLVDLNMFYKLGRHVFIRNIHNSMFLWDKITDNRIIGDEIAYIFVKSVSYQPKSYDCIIDEITAVFSDDVDRFRIQNDVDSFYKQLESVGIIFSGSSEDECEEKAAFHRYDYSTDMQPSGFDCEQYKLSSFLKKPAI